VWQIESYGDQYDNWYLGLTEDQQDAVVARLDILRNVGPTLGGEIVKKIEDSKHHNMKELRISKGGALRILFIFDPTSKAILLVGGDKTGKWNKWYRQAIDEADHLYDQYLQELRDEEGRG
jgi:hypothetical protein